VGAEPIAINRARGSSIQHVLWIYIILYIVIFCEVICLV